MDLVSPFQKCEMKGIPEGKFVTPSCFEKRYESPRILDFIFTVLSLFLAIYNGGQNTLDTYEKTN